ncbi:MAG TPA: GNAT family N-acetyltransferase [Stellaceae bacterium]|nr:GNAT family N-acetyltransferase [Stellaceae bacterium]
MIDEPWLARLTIEPLDRKKHDRWAFSCGIERIDVFLKKIAAQQADRDTFRTYVAIEPPSNAILGYYALGPHGIDVSQLPPEDQKRMPRHPTVGAIYLSMVGVDSHYQKRGLGAYLLADALRTCVEVADKIGGAFVVLDALNEGAARLYRRCGFHDLPGPGHETRMIMPMKKVRAAIADA